MTSWASEAVACSVNKIVNDSIRIQLPPCMFVAPISKPTFCLLEVQPRSDGHHKKTYLLTALPLYARIGAFFHKSLAGLTLTGFGQSAAISSSQSTIVASRPCCSIANVRFCWVKRTCRLHCICLLLTQSGHRGRRWAYSATCSV